MYHARDGTKKAEATGTCGAVTGTEDAVLLSDHVRYPGIPIELTYKRSDTGIKIRQNMMHRSAQPAAGASTRLRPVSATRQMQIGRIFSLVLLMLIGLLCVSAGHVPEMCGTGRELPDEQQTNEEDNMKRTVNRFTIALLGVIMVCLLAVPAMADYNLNDVANADIPVSGTVTGSYLDAHTSNNIHEAITEENSGGAPSSRISYLEHKWTINVTGGDRVTFYVEAYRTANSEDDNFVFAYSEDDSIYTDMVTITKTADDGTYQTFELPETLNGTAYIRVKDTNREGGLTVLDTIYVDHMYIRSVVDTTPPAITNATGDTSSTTGEAKTISATITDDRDVISAAVHYTPIDGTETIVQMTEGAGDVWSADVPVDSDKVGTITYYITAEDEILNIARDPATRTYNITVTDNDAPGVISDLTATAMAGGGIELAWSAAADNVGVVSYNVYRNLSVITDATGLTPIANVTETTYTDWTGDEGTTYYYAVIAVDAAGNKGDASNSPSATADATLPSSITILSPTNTTYHTTIINLEVSTDEPVDQYQWWYNLNSEGNTTFTPNSTIIAQLGYNHLIVYASDTAGNVNSSEVYFSTSNYINTCSVLNSENTTYYLTMDIINSTATACIVITADNVTLDCQGHTIDGNLSLTVNSEDNKYGIYSNNSYTTIKNGKISNWQNGIYLDSGADNGYIENNSITEVFGASSGGNAAGIFLKSKYNVVYNNSISSLTGREAGGTATGIYLENSILNDLSSNLIYNLTGEDGKAVGSYVSGRSGGSVTGIYLKNSASNNLTSTSISNLTAGHGGTAYVAWGGAGGTVAGVRLKNSTSNSLTSISISNLTAGYGGTDSCWGHSRPKAIDGMAMGIWLDINSYDNMITELTTKGSYKIPEDNALNKINGKPILYFYNETGLNIFGYNITTDTPSVLISGEEGITIASGITLINTTDSITHLRQIKIKTLSVNHLIF